MPAITGPSPAIVTSIAVTPVMAVAAVPVDGLDNCRPAVGPWRGVGDPRTNTERGRADNAGDRDTADESFHIHALQICAGSGAGRPGCRQNRYPR